MSRTIVFIGVFIIVFAVLGGVWMNSWFSSGTEPDEGERRRAPFTYQDMMVVDTPTAGQEVVSPLTVKGEARGPWYFEANFPVTLRSQEGKVLAETYAQTYSDWMTEDFVPFSFELEFSVSEPTKAEIVLQKANPSGRPENADQAALPVKLRP